MMTIDQLVAEIGTTVLYLGSEYQTASDAALVSIGKTARGLGFDSILVKKADGGIRFYHDEQALKNTKAAVNGQAGIGCFFYAYCYGPKFGNAQIQDEAIIQQELARAEGRGVCVADMEAEYNGYPGAAHQFAESVMAGENNPMDGWIVTSWADPVQQNWEGVLAELNPHMAAFNPQQYTSWLLGQEGQLAQVAGKLLPAVNIWADALSGASQARMKGHKGLWCWEAQGAMQNPSLARSMIRTFKG